MRRLFGLTAVVWGMGTAGAEAACRLALVLALDVSASVDDAEYRLQLLGTAAALVAPSVRAALLDPGSPPVAISAFAWSGPNDQFPLADWTIIDSEAALNDLASRIASRPRDPAISLRTATGNALLWAEGLMRAEPGCDRRVVDIATDGTFNAGVPPEGVRSGASYADITINGLAVQGSQIPDWRDGGTKETALAAYLTRSVIRGPGAFVETAQTYADFERAMTRKLERELAGMVLGQLP